MPTNLTGPLLENADARGAREWFANLPLGLAAPDCVVYFNDFLTAGAYSATDYTITTTEAGTGDATEAVSTSEACGALVITNDDGDADIDSLQQTVSAWKLTAGKGFWFETRVKLSNLTSTLLIGLAETDTTPLDAANRVNFRVTSGSTSILCQADSTADTAVSTASGAVVAADTWVRLGFSYNGSNLIKFFVDRAFVASTSTAIPAASQALCLTMYLANGATAPDAAKALSVDYVLIAQER